MGSWVEREEEVMVGVLVPKTIFQVLGPVWPKESKMGRWMRVTLFHFNIWKASGFRCFERYFAPLGTPALPDSGRTHPSHPPNEWGSKLLSIASDIGDVSRQAVRKAGGCNLNKMSLFRGFFFFVTYFFCDDKSQACAGDNNTKCLTAFLTIVWHFVCLIIVSITHAGKLLLKRTQWWLSECSSVILLLSPGLQFGRHQFLLCERLI